MLDLSQFETDLPPIRDGYTYNLVHGLIAECRRLQENNRELCAFLKDDVLDELDDNENTIQNAGWTRHQQAELESVQQVIVKTKSLIAKNQGAKP